MNKENKKIIVFATLSLMFAVIIGAFGAHALRSQVTEKMMQTFHTGSTYHFYHSFALLILAITSMQTKVKLTKAAYFFIAGIFFFSFNCYIYTISGVKTFALLVPIGGVSFIIGWFLFSLKIIKEKL